MITSARKLNALSAQREVLLCIIPLIVLTLAMSNKPGLLFVTVFHVASMCSIICAAWLFWNAAGNKIIATSTVSLLLIARVLQLFVDSLILTYIYYIPYTIVFFGVGALIFRDYRTLIVRQICWLVGLCLVIELLQISGFQIFQSISNYHSTDGGSSDHVWFVKWEEISGSANAQLRPVGFTHANNVTSQLLVLFYGFVIIPLTKKKANRFSACVWLLVLGTACALSGAKLVIASVLVLSIVAIYLQRKSPGRAFAGMCCVIFAYILYWICFPGLFIYNYNLDLIGFNALLRIENANQIVGIPWSNYLMDYLQQFNTGDYIGVRSVETTLEHYNRELDGSLHAKTTAAMTGMAQLLSIWGYLIGLILVIGILWKRRYHKVCFCLSREAKHSMFLTATACVLCTFGGPFLGTNYFLIFVSMGVYPLSSVLLRSTHSAC